MDLLSRTYHPRYHNECYETQPFDFKFRGEVFLICSWSVNFDRIFHLDHLPLDRLLYEGLTMKELYDQMRFRSDYVANS